MLQRGESGGRGLGLSHLPTSPVESWEDEGGLATLRVLHHGPCLTLALPGENFLLEIAGFPIPIFGVRRRTGVAGSLEGSGDSLA